MANAPKHPVVQVAGADGTLLNTGTGSDGSALPAPLAAVTNLTGANQAVSAAAKDYRGFSIRETAGSTAVVVIFDNASAASGTILEEIGLVANESAREFYNPGIKTANGIYVQVVSGAVAGSVRTA